MKNKARRLGLVVVLFMLVLMQYLGVGISCVWAADDLAAQEGFVSHKALYEIRLSSKKSSATVSNVSGIMRYEWHSSCDGWVSNHQFDMLYEYTEMPAVHVTSDFSTYESFDKKDFNFTVQRKKDGFVFQSLRGNAHISELDQVDAKNEVIYSQPRNLTQDLPSGTIFPTTHTLDVLNAIKQGKHFYKAVLFDGSDEEGAAEVNAFIGKEFLYQVPESDEKASKAQDENKIDTALLNTKAWNIRLAFFPTETNDATADYEMSVVFHENGIISSMDVDYDDFSISQNLVALEPVSSDCEGK